MRGCSRGREGTFLAGGEWNTEGLGLRGWDQQKRLQPPFPGMPALHRASWIHQSFEWSVCLMHQPFLPGPHLHAEQRWEIPGTALETEAYLSACTFHLATPSPFVRSKISWLPFWDSGRNFLFFIAASWIGYGLAVFHLPQTGSGVFCG